MADGGQCCKSISLAGVIVLFVQKGENEIGGIGNEMLEVLVY